MSLIHRYAKTGDIEGIARELALGTPIDLIDSKWKLSPLGVAALRGSANAETLRFLLEKGADVNFTNRKGTSALWFAMSGSDPEKVQALLAAGADTNIPQSSLDYQLSSASSEGRFLMVDLLFRIGANPEELNWSPLMKAAALGSKADVEREISLGGDLEERDDDERTPWLLSLQSGDLEKVKLLATVSDLSVRGEFGETPLEFAVKKQQVKLLAWLIEKGADLEEKNEFGETALIVAVKGGATECVRVLLNSGARPDNTNKRDESAAQIKARYEAMYAQKGIPLPPFSDMDFEKMSCCGGQKPISLAANMEIVRLLIERGEELAEIDSDLRNEFLGLELSAEYPCSWEEFETGWLRRFGKSNPEKMEIPLWKKMVQKGNGSLLIDPPMTIEKRMECSPLWCYHRFGMSITELTDGRVIEIGGEHEDSYDRDFCIYNEVLVHHGGGNLDIFGYPEDVFPPTDFHTATLVGEFIYIIGSLGYQGKRSFGKTPVYRLNTSSLVMEKIATSGEMPGWIYQHKAIFDAERNEIRISGGKVCKKVKGQEEYLDNANHFILKLTTMTWHRVR